MTVVSSAVNMHMYRNNCRTRVRQCIRKNQLHVDMSMVVLLFTLCWNVVKATQPTITGTDAVLGSDTSLRCVWPGAFTLLEWGRSPLNETTFSEAEILVAFTPPDSVAYLDEKRFSFNKDDSENPLTIKNITRKDGVRYWCGLETSPPSDGSFFDLNIIVPPDENKTSSTANGKPIKPGGIISATVGVELSIVFNVFDISPGAKFEWMLDSLKLPETTVNKTQDDGLITSTSTATWTPSAGDSGKTKALTCTASNGAPNVVTLPVTVQVEAITTTEEPTPTPGTTMTTGSHERLSDGVIIGIVAGCLGGVAIIAVGSVAAWNYHKKTDVSPQTDQSKNGKDGKDKTANGKADDKPAGTADV